MDEFSVPSDPDFQLPKENHSYYSQSMQYQNYEFQDQVLFFQLQFKSQLSLSDHSLQKDEITGHSLWSVAIYFSS